MSSVAYAEAHIEAPLADSGVSGWWKPRFPSPEGLDLAAMMLPARPAWQGEEGPRPRLVLSAGAFAIEAPDLARRERRHERALLARQLDASVAATYYAREERPPDRVPCREITGWSRKSRANMVRALCELDYRPMLADPMRIPAMVTLTYPGDWLAVAPNGRIVKEHMAALRKRYSRAWGRYVVCPHADKPIKPRGWLWTAEEADVEWRPRGHNRCSGVAADCWEGDPLMAVWKLEFQHRGAPHIHLLMVPPHGLARTPGGRARADARVGAGLPFRQWLSEVWADIVGADDTVPGVDGQTDRAKHAERGTDVAPVDEAEFMRSERERHRLAGTGVDFAEGLRAYDPKRVSVYFVKHGSFAAKEYQHIVPEPWQEPGMGPGRFWGYWGLQRRTAAVEVTPEDAVRAARIARRWARAQGTTRQVSVARRRGGIVRQVQPDVISVAGAQLLARGEPTRRRTVRRRVRRFGSGRGFVSVNNGALFGLQLSRALDLLRSGSP